jgi:uncharacterized protein (TIGR02598 family)
MRTRTTSAFSLVEVSMALGIAAFCLVTIFALLPVGLNSNKAAIEQTNAMNVISAVAADLRATPASSGTATSPLFGISVPPQPAPGAGAGTIYTSGTYYFGIDGQCSGTSTSTNSRYKLQAWLTSPSNIKTNTLAKAVTKARLLMTWPALASSTNASGYVETVVALDRN